MTVASLYEIPLRRIDGSPSRLADYRGKVLLVVNVVSKCGGLTPQYAGLESLYQKRCDKGLELLGLPANNFKRQEPGSDGETRDFYSVNYDFHFPLLSKIPVLGEDQHPLYAQLTAAKPAAIGDGPFRERLKGNGEQFENPADVLRNFEKFLLSRNSEVVARFAPDVTADDPRLVSAIEEEPATGA
jgi:glutathione peroxidase